VAIRPTEDVWTWLSLLFALGQMGNGKWRFNPRLSIYL
jgi:hypothetical protein